MKTDKPSINISGRRVNKLEEIVDLLQKLNEDFYSEEERKEAGYPLTITIRADGSGAINEHNMWVMLHTFDSLVELEEFLKANRRTQFQLGKSSTYNKVIKEKA